MKMIKNLALAALTVVALVSCGGETTVPTEKAPMIVKFDGKQITADTTVVISKTAETISGGVEMVFECNVLNNTEKEHDYTITEDRGSMDMSKYEMSGCVDQCIPGNGEKIQDWDLDTLVPEEEKSFSSHFGVKPEALAEAAKVPVVYSFTDGEKVIKVTVNFDYPGAK